MICIFFSFHDRCRCFWCRLCLWLHKHCLTGHCWYSPIPAEVGERKSITRTCRHCKTVFYTEVAR